MTQPPLLSAGFRPFFLAAGFYGACSVPQWILDYTGIVDFGSHVSAPWHAHEMLFGYMLAVLTGFLTIRLSGWPLAVLFGIWVAGRIAMSLPAPGGPVVAMIVDLSFLPALITLRKPAFWTVWKWPNGVFLPLLLGFWVVDLVVHLSGRQVATLLRTPDLGASGIDLAVLLLVVIGGRLVPGYTGATLTHIRPARQLAIELTSVGILIAIAVLHAASLETWAGLCLLLVSALQGVRMFAWHSWETLRRPLLWILHLGYGWLVIGLALRGVGDLWPSIIPPSVALHAVTAGAIGSLTLGMMTRITLVHTRRVLEADRLTTFSFILMQLAALARVAGPLVASEETTAWLWAAAALWSSALAIWLVRHARMLLA